MAWIYLFVAGLFEIGWAVGLKYTHGFTRLTPSVLTVAAMAVSLFMLGLALRSLPLGTAYAIWTGIGALGSFVVGILLMGEPATAMRIGAAGLIVGFLVALYLPVFELAGQIK